MKDHNTVFLLKGNQHVDEMILSLQDIMEICYRLERVLPQIQRGKFRYTCIAIDCLEMVDDKYSELTKEYIISSLNDVPDYSPHLSCNTVEQWLRSRKQPHNREAARKVRVWFIRDMIRELKSILKEYNYPF